MREKDNKHLSMALAGALSFLFLGIFFAWSMFRVEIEKLYGYSAAQMSLNFSIAISFFCLGGFFGGRLTGKRGAGFTLRLSAALSLLGYLGASMMEHFTGSAALGVLYASYGVLLGFGTGLGYNVGLANVAPWFPRHIGLVSGIMLMGFGLSGALFSFVTEGLSPVIGIFSVLRIFGLAVFAVLMLASRFIRRPPAAEGGSAARDVGEDAASRTPGQMVRSLSFWVYFLWNVLSGAAGLLVIGSAAGIALYFGAAASVGTLVSAFNGCSRPFVGYVADRVSRTQAMLFMTALVLASALLLLLTAWTGSIAAMLLGLLFLGAAYGGGATLSAKVISQTYGPRYYAVNHSICNFCMLFSSFLGPYLSGIVQDRTGGYTGTFLLLLLIAAVELALWAVMRRVLAVEEAAI